MDDALTWSLALFAALALPSLVLLRSWEGWLALRASAQSEDRRSPLELADLKDRVRRLEKIADGLER